MAQQSFQPPAPGPSPSFTAGPIVLGTEFGPVSTAAERVAIGLARQAGVPLVIVHAIDPGRLRLPGGRFRERVDQAHSARQRDASVLIERVRAAGVEPQLLMWDGDPATCVLDAAKAEGASRIVVGSHGRGRLGRAIIGSVSSMIAGQADCPVDIVRGNDATEEIVTVAPVLRRI
ncbi:MAG TPA: universal stress protein [Candidatus Limnocylindrales bacterium]|jgi:nucleotide-binding universal stress UspA family protein